ncbi:ABC transporter substrate-binding protein [Agromyces archimandritae]|uniref:ABC transporter substrate-binding protein n=1 Tax=Agromyces archimandritae TaxID=2781962 RepID=A0A975FLS8_9MICO|nr:ABC transporter substrate-binding protein [Agromyces archimandritae]QTX04082.1 ABC transporter substrate-binding protein [Agromyces archimandritae]
MLAKNMRKRALVATGLVAALGLSACSSSGDNDNGAPGDGAALVVWAGENLPLVANFNPYSPTALNATAGKLYEPLFLYNSARADDPIPRLGESYEWSEDGRELTVGLRSGVEWNDGESLTPDDVVFSFTNDAMSMDYLDDVEVVDDTTVTFHFNAPSFSDEYTVLGATYIVPEHVFGEVDDLVTFANDTDPVGTGPFEVEHVTDAAYTLVANPDYWDEGHPEISRVQYLGIEDGNTSAESLFKTDQLDYATFFVPDPDSLTSSPDIGYIETVGSNPTVMLICSNAELGCEGAQTDKALRQALNLAIDRDEIIEKAYYGLASPGSATFVMPGRDDDWIADGMPMVNEGSAETDAARAVLETAGYTEGSDGIYEKDGVRASIEFESVEGWSDQNAAADLIAAQAKRAGIELKTNTLTQDQYLERRSSGDYQMFMGALFGTSISDPYKIYRDSFTTNSTEPVGTSLSTTQTNFSRYSNPDVDNAVSVAAGTNDEAEKQAAYAIVQENIVEDVPYINLLHSHSQTFMNDAGFGGWPTEDDLYISPASYGGAAAGYLLSRLSYK